MGMTPERGPGRKSCEQTEQGERGHAGSSWEVGKDEGPEGGRGSRAQSWSPMGFGGNYAFLLRALGSHVVAVVRVALSGV